ncbi:MAG: SmdB family multidrug efflux ABC transporter permease/ATP-binding protein [Buchnera aphidicola (Nurudea yanoniella)]
MKYFEKFYPILKKLLSYGIKQKKSLILGCFLLLLASIFEVLGPVLINCFVKSSIINNYMNFSLLFLITFTYILLQVLSALLNYFQNIIFNKISIKIVEKLRINLMSSILKLPIKTFNKKPISQFISCINNDTEIIKELYETFITILFKNIVLILVTLIAMFALEWRMASIAVTIFPLALTTSFLYQYYSKPVLKKSQIYLSKIYNLFNETICGMTVIQQFGLEKKFKCSIEETNESYYLNRMKVLKLDGIFLRPLLNFFSTIILCSLIILFEFYPRGSFEIGTLYAFITYLGRLNEPLIAITAQQSILQKSILSGKRIFKLIDAQKQIYGKDPNNLDNGEIHIKNLSFSYENKNIETLKNINLHISSKKFIALVGHTGSGKSTLAQLLMGYYPVTKGHIYLNKRNIHSLSKEVLKNGISIVQQDPCILDDSILNNITLGRKISKSKIWNILKKVHLSKTIRSMPNSIYSILGENGNILSIGQKQLLCIARILVDNPKILILDEATSNVDLKTEKKIQKILSQINYRTTLIVIAHRLSTIKNADKIFVFNNGEIVEKGKHNSLLKNRKNYWKMYNNQNKENTKSS